MSLEQTLPRRNHFSEFLANNSSILYAASCSSFASRIAMHPVDTIKAKLQSQTSSARKSSWQIISTTVAKEGISGLYKGIGLALFGSIPAGILYFASYEASKKMLAPVLPESQNLANLTSGFIAEAFSCVLWVPIDVIKERFQTQSLLEPRYQYSGYGDAFRQMYKEGGMRSFYRGYGATLLSFGPFSALYFMTYELFKKHFSTTTFFKDRQLEATMTAGFLSGGFASFCTNPLDLVKLRIQIQRRGVMFGYKNTFEGLGHEFMEVGLRGLFKGVTARMLYHAPATSISIAVYEYMKNKRSSE